MIYIFLKTTIKEGIVKIKQYILGLNKIIKGIEYIRGIYRYPKSMAGRKFDLNRINNDVDVLILAAHPDDDVLGLGTTLYRHSLTGSNIVVVFVTNGSGISWNNRKGNTLEISNMRYKEASQALSLIKIPQENILSLGYPDQGSHRYLKYIAKDINLLIEKLHPKLVYTHCIEGGHSDHDMTSFVVKKVCKKIGFDNLYEWTEYNPRQSIGSKNVRFLPSKVTNFDEEIIDVSNEERMLKKDMLSFHKSQNIEKFYDQGEAIRKSSFVHIENDLQSYCSFPKKRIKVIVQEFNKSKGDI